MARVFCGLEDLCTRWQRLLEARARICRPMAPSEWTLQDQSMILITSLSDPICLSYNPPHAEWSSVKGIRPIPQVGVNSGDPGVYRSKKAYVTALATLRAGLLLHRTRLRLRRIDPHQRPFQPHCSTCREPWNGLPLRVVDRTLLVWPCRLGVRTQR